MIRVAIVEDEPREVELLKTNLKRFFSETGTDYVCTVYPNGVEFLEAYRGDCDVVLMDIEMPALNGYRTAEKLREAGSDAEVVFVTNLSDFAVKGYDVEAAGFIVKPVTYAALKMNLRKAVARAKDKAGVTLAAVTRNGINVIYSARLVYVEVMRHNLIYHTADGEAFTARGSLKEVEQKLEGFNFARCNNCFLVNLRYVKRVDEDYVLLKTAKLPISRSRKKEFTDAVMSFIGERGGAGGGT